MPISIKCPDCEKSLKVPDRAAGRKIHCPACQSVIRVAQPEGEEAPKKKSSPPPIKKPQEDVYDAFSAVEEPKWKKKE